MLVNIFIEFMSMTDATLFANIVAILPKSMQLKLFPILYFFLSVNSNRAYVYVMWLKSNFQPHYLSLNL